MFAALENQPRFILLMILVILKISMKGKTYVQTEVCVNPLFITPAEDLVC